jgi:hypothetical protein
MKVNVYVTFAVESTDKKTAKELIQKEISILLGRTVKNTKEIIFAETTAIEEVD